MQYTIRGISPALDAALRRRAREDGKSLNAVTVAAIAQGVGFGQDRPVRRDLSDVAGTWRRDAAVEEGLAAQDQVDRDMWK